MGTQKKFFANQIQLPKYRCKLFRVLSILFSFYINFFVLDANHIFQLARQICLVNCCKPHKNHSSLLGI